MSEKIENYKVKLEDWHEGVFATSLVGEPAIESDFVFFAKEGLTVLNFGDEEKREVVGAIMIPGQKIPRKDPNTGEVFTVEFSAEVISQLNERMKEYGYDNSFTFHHAYSTQGNVQILESWIKEFDADKSNGYGFDLPIGTMFMKVKIKEDNLWEMIKENKLNGFSIELNAGYELDKGDDNMSKIEAFEYNKEMENFNLVWDGSEEITAETLLFSVTKETVEDKEVEKVQKFSGDFSIEDVDYKAENGIVSIVEKEVEKQGTQADVFNKDEMIEAINVAVTAQFDSLKEMFGKQKEDSDKIAESLEEVKLFQKQGDSNAGKETDDVDEVFTAEMLKENREAFKRWDKKMSGKSTQK